MDAILSGAHDGRGRRHTAKPGDAGARDGVKLREGKVVRPDGESQDGRVATGGLDVPPGQIRHKP
jgi:hypothetical protein